MNKKEIQDVLIRILNKEEVVPEDVLRAFTAAMEAVTLRTKLDQAKILLIKEQKENTDFRSLLEQTEADYKKLLSDYKTMEEGTKVLCEQINKVDAAWRVHHGLFEFMSNLVIATEFGESKVIDIAKALYKGKELGKQPKLLEDKHGDGCCGGDCDCKD